MCYLQQFCTNLTYSTVCDSILEFQGVGQLESNLYFIFDGILGVVAEGECVKKRVKEAMKETWAAMFFINGKKLVRQGHFLVLVDQDIALHPHPPAPKKRNQRLHSNLFLKKKKKHNKIEKIIIQLRWQTKQKK